MTILLLLFAQATPTPANPDGLLDTSPLKYMIQGGLFMWPILVCGILTAAVILERLRSLKMLNVDTARLRGQVLDLLQQNQAKKALDLCTQERGPVPAILSAGLRQYVVLRELNYDVAATKQEVDKAMEDYGVHIVAALERHLPILATMASVAPMLGFLGTVQGMVVSFDDIVQQYGKVDIVLAAAGGIKIALLTTVFGLVVGIPAFTAYNYFTSVINRYVLEVEESASELIEVVTLQTALQEKK